MKAAKKKTPAPAPEAPPPRHRPSHRIVRVGPLAHSRCPGFSQEGDPVQGHHAAPRRAARVPHHPRRNRRAVHRRARRRDRRHRGARLHLRGRPRRAVERLVRPGAKAREASGAERPRLVRNGIQHHRARDAQRVAPRRRAGTHRRRRTGYGGTARAAADLVKKQRGSVVGFAFVIELGALGGRDTLGAARVESILTY